MPSKFAQFILFSPVFFLSGCEYLSGKIDLSDEFRQTTQCVIGGIVKVKRESAALPLVVVGARASTLDEAIDAACEKYRKEKNTPDCQNLVVDKASHMIFSQNIDPGRSLDAEDSLLGKTDVETVTFKAPDEVDEYVVSLKEKD